MAAWNKRYEPIYRRYEQGRHGRNVLARTILPLPNPNDTTSQATRFEHRDLALMAARELWQECERARLALILSDLPDPWVCSRGSAPAKPNKPHARSAVPHERLNAVVGP